MAKLSYKISYYVLYALFAAILVVLGLFYFGGDATGDAVLPVDADMWQPAQTDALLYLNYFLFAFAAVAAIVSFVYFLTCNPRASQGSLIVLVGSIVVLAIGWLMGSDELLVIQSYEGTDNVGFWAHATDMFIFSIEILLGVSLVAAVAGAIKKALS